ncbi:MAG: UpxY family transcription antiterminator [Candidatus Kapabacteria bacterium]|nr:UpxY family transcription antiterminator [Ignavibacteriota bacterium]MCW5885691.1 UpxY family transcription antiterminator [Candidatus Kapabacteria bacterium]
MNNGSNNQDDLTPKWYPFYTRSRYEKKVYEGLIVNGYEAYLPLVKSERNWSDRKKIVEMPLFTSYIFIRIPKFRLFDVLKFPGIVRFIKFNNIPAVIRDSEIDLIKNILSQKTEIEVIDGILEQGTEIFISSGIFKGYKGRYLESKGKNKLIIEIESINKTMLVTINKDSIKI